MRKPKNRAVEHRATPQVHGLMTLVQSGDAEFTISFSVPAVIEGPVQWPAFEPGFQTEKLPISQEPATGKTNTLILTYADACDFALGIRVIPGDPMVRTIYGGHFFPEYGPCS